MPWPAYLAAHTEGEHRVWCAFFSAHQFNDMWAREKDPAEVKVGDGPDDHVPTATWERWQGKVAGAKFAFMTKGKPMTPDQIAQHKRMIDVKFRMAREAGPRFEDPKPEG